MPSRTKSHAHLGCIPADGWMRISQIIGDPSRGIPPIVPVSRSGWYAGIREGKFPAPVKLGPRVSAWKASDIRALVVKLGA